jgi:hypothetical protein
MSKNIIIIHAAILEKCKERILQYLSVIKDSNLINNIDSIIICFIGKNEMPLNYHDITEYNQNNIIKMIKLSNNLLDYELPTLNLLYNFCNQNRDYNVLYLHTKNVGKETNLCIEEQIEYMLYFLVSKWEKCINNLLEYDTCGVDLRKELTLHYSGNFWWSNANNIISLPSPIEFSNLSVYPNPLNSARHNQEFWVCYNRNKKHLSMWDCGISVYERHLHRYPKESYVSS